MQKLYKKRITYMKRKKREIEKQLSKEKTKEYLF